MDEPFVGMISTFGFDFAPRYWMKCDGQLLPITQYQTLFSLIGTIYGGDGRTTFALPDLRGRVALHEGHGPGLSDRVIGQKGGSENTMLITNNLPPHNHGATVGGSVQMPVSASSGNTDSPSGAYLTSTSTDFYADTVAAGEFSGALTSNLSVTLGMTGGSMPVNNMQPYLTINYCICVNGIYPSRS
ncbi:MAG: phage tail protein [Saprospiraceae bacterium]|nr:phage tail protein [Saprospiraceae bacterium]